jgi:diaminopimelate decarboxylase
MITSLDYKDGVLWWGEVNLKKVAEEFDTPVFVYSLDEFIGRMRAISKSANYDHLLCFSLKSNSVLALLREAAREGFGADVVSAGELFIAEKAGFPGDKIVFSGVGKTNKEILYANEKKVLLVNIESESEYNFIKKLSSEQKINFGVSFRVKFEVQLEKLHPYLGVGKKNSKFGIDESLAFSLYEDASKAGLPVSGIHFHLGSQIKDMEIFRNASELALDFLSKLKKHGIKINYVDVGGGLGLDYENLVDPTFSEYTACFEPIAREGYKIIFELGRAISAPSGILITKIIRKKYSGGKKFFIVDAGMTEILRIPLYKAYHKVIPLEMNNAHNEEQVSVVGPICENSDYIAQDIVLPDLSEGDLLCILYAGAYTSTMTMNYNGRPLPAEIVIKGKNVFCARKRQTYEDLIARDI